MDPTRPRPRPAAERGTRLQLTASEAALLLREHNQAGKLTTADRAELDALWARVAGHLLSLVSSSRVLGAPESQEMPHPWALWWIVLYSTEPELRDQAMSCWTCWNSSDFLFGTVCT